MGEIKRELNSFRLYDLKSMEQKLQHMASKGWELKKVNSVFCTYQRRTPANSHFHVTYIPLIQGENEWDKAIRLEEKMSEYTTHGWTHICNYQNMLIFTRELNQPVTLEFTPMEQLESLSDIICVDNIKSLLLVSLFLCLYLLYFVFRFMQKPIETFSSSIYLLLTTFLVNALLVLVFDIIYNAYWYKKAKKTVLKKGYIPTMISKLLYYIWFIPSYIVAALGIYTSKITRLCIIVMIIIAVFPLLVKYVLKKVRNKLRIRLSRSTYTIINITTAILSTILLFFGLYQLFLHTDIRYIAISRPVETYEYEGSIYQQYGDAIPLNIEQFSDKEAIWSKRATYDETFLLSYGKYVQESISKRNNDYIVIEYTIADIKWNYLYALCKKGIFQKYASDDRNYKPLENLSTDSYEVYKVSYGYGQYSQYIVLYDQRIVTFNFYSTFDDIELENAIKLFEP